MVVLEPEPEVQKAVPSEVLQVEDVHLTVMDRVVQHAETSTDKGADRDEACHVGIVRQLARQRKV